MAMGTVKVWSKAGGFGWIEPDGRGDRVYVHKSAVTRRDPDRAASLEPRSADRRAHGDGAARGGRAALAAAAAAPPWYHRG